MSSLSNYSTASIFVNRSAGGREYGEYALFEGISPSEEGDQGAALDPLKGRAP